MYFSAHDRIYINVLAAQGTKAELFKKWGMAMERIQANQKEAIAVM